MEEIRLHTESLTVGYEKKTVLQDITFSVRSGEILTLIGSNGAGKSTILKTIAKQLRPLAGTVFLGKDTLSEMNETTLAQRLSVMTTERVHTEWMTCADVVTMGRYPYTGRLGLLSEHDKTIVKETMQLLGISELAERYFSCLSDGQRQRVMLGRAICQEPEILLLDEPTSFLDVRYKLEFLTTLRMLAKERKIAVVMSLHELDCAERISDWVLCVKDGAVDRIGTTAEIFSHRYIETLYGMKTGSYDAFFGTAEGNRQFFQNRACQSFPCHKGVAIENFNCLFCYCPLYPLGEACGGNFHYTANGIKSCIDCSFPHHRQHYEKVLAHWSELAALAGRHPK